METFLYLTLGSGKVTTAIIAHPNNIVEVGVAFCSPYDQFVKDRGRKIALDRLQNKKDFYISFDKDDTVKLKWQVKEIVRYAISGKWVSVLDFETELGTKVHELITETSNDFPNDIVPMTIHTNTIPTWAKRAVEEKNFY